MSYSQNARNIEGNFKAFRMRAFEEMKNGLESVLRAGVEFCLNEHDGKFHRHLDTGDSYGWVLFYKGTELNREIWAKDKEAKGNASQVLDSLQAGANPSGFDGYVVAGMTLAEGEDADRNSPGRYFKWRYEFIPMRKGISDIKQLRFEQYFKKI